MSSQVILTCDGCGQTGNTPVNWSCWCWNTMERYVEKDYCPQCTVRFRELIKQALDHK